MSTNHKPDDLQVRQRVAGIRALMLKSRIARGLIIWWVVCLGTCLVLFALDNLLHLPAGLRLALSLGAVGWMAFELWQRLLRLVVRRQGLDRTAVFLEDRFSIPENMLINALYFESAQLTPGQAPFAQKTITTGSVMLTRANTTELWQFKTLGRWSAVLVTLILIWMVYSLCFGHQVANAWLRYLKPLGDVPPASSIVLRVTPGDDIVVAEGEDLVVRVDVVGLKPFHSLPTYPDLVWQRDIGYVSHETDTYQHTTMQRGDPTLNTYSYTFASVNESFAFRVFGGGTYSKSIQVTVNRVPRIKESEFHMTPPAYTGKGRMSLLGPPEALTGPKGSNVAIDIKLDKHAEALWYKGASDWIAFENHNGLWTTNTRLLPAESYQIEVKAPDFAQRMQIAQGPILVQSDQPPKVEFVTSEWTRRVYPGERLRVDVQAYDDFGARSMGVTVKSVRADGVTPLENWEYEGPPGQTEARETLLLSMDASRFKPGSSYILEAFCKDFSPANHTGRSRPLTLQVRSLDAMTLAEEDPNNDAFAELDLAIQAQQSALGLTANVQANLDDIMDAKAPQVTNRQAVQGHVSQMSKKQEQVGSHLTRAWQVSMEPKPKFVTELKQLRDNEQAAILKDMTQTASLEPVDHRSVLRGLKTIEMKQRYLLDQLIAIKGLLAKQGEAAAQKAVADLLGEQDESPDPTPEETLEDTVKELDQFITEQRAITEKRQKVLDQAPEDFSDEQIDLLEALAMEQSKLADVLKGVVDDLSNMNLLDFGDSQMVDDLKSITQHAEALADKALQAANMQQARQDAYRLETEAVEMAEELMINCEATLGARDSIQFVAEIPEDEQLFAPLAELPSELEDLVGDMITSEEEMRPEVEDIGSYLNSLDHTAGPVADGTISSTSAKGKTGDQKPEDNVIEGRSGAGRTGMSDGQLVESVAKDLTQNEYGLRERVSNTPLENGQVEDQDKGAATGGSGLGKTTDGTTEFGVGGRLPPKVLSMMANTLAKQQTIRQASQDLVLKLKRHNLSVTELDQSIQAMTHLEDSLKRGDGIGIRSAYQNTLDRLRTSHKAIGTQLSMQSIQATGQAAAFGKRFSRSPTLNFKGYNSMVNAYFEALARTDRKDQ